MLYESWLLECKKRSLLGIPHINSNHAKKDALSLEKAHLLFFNERALDPLEFAELI